MKIIDERETQEQTNKQTKKNWTRVTESIVKGWDINDSVEH